MTASAPVSVVIAVFEGAPFLGEAIESVLAQAPTPAEVIVVDDGSTDGSGGVARAFGHRVGVIGQPHRGVSAARNAGIAVASQPFLGVCDADDLWNQGRVELALDVFARDSAAEAVFGHVSEFTTSGAAGATGATSRGTRPPRQRVPGWVAGSMLIQRAAFERVGGFDERFRYGEFIDWLDRARGAALEMRMLPDVVLLRRIHGANMTADADYSAKLTSVLRESLRRRRSG